MNCHLKLALMFGALALAAHPTLAGPLPDVPTSGDTFDYQFLSTFNFSTGPFASLLSAGQTGIGHDTHSLLQFNLSSLGVSSANVESASLKLFVTSTSATGFGLDPSAANPIQVDLTAVGGAQPSWSASTVTWGTEPTTTGGIAASATISGINEWVTLDVTSLVKQWLSGSLANNGVLLTQDAIVPGAGSFYVGVFDSSSAANPPVLSITSVPEPGTAALLLCALPALAWSYRRARRVVRGR